MSSREEFVAWYLRRFDLPEDAELNFGNESIKFALEVWEASRAGQVVELPQLSKPTPWESTDNAWNNAVKACAKAIQAAGIPVKQS
ncbi:hypothetical protein [Pseudomonas sp.]|uniref:hypothetical protein n=1 Tax=Pseudomonas sp. TaxID=306 RepID=UPI002897BA18|nr:hypothetical protein [Pseudomonas sp.]